MCVYAYIHICHYYIRVLPYGVLNNRSVLLCCCICKYIHLFIYIHAHIYICELWYSTFHLLLCCICKYIHFYIYTHTYIFVSSAIPVLPYSICNNGSVLLAECVNLHIRICIFTYTHICHSSNSNFAPSCLQQKVCASVLLYM